MTSDRDAFLSRVRDSVQAGNAAGRPPLPSRGDVGYQGGGDDLIGTFCLALESAGGIAHRVESVAEAMTELTSLCQQIEPRSVFLGAEPVLERVGASEIIRKLGANVVRPQLIDADSTRADYFACDLAMTGADYAIAESGSLVVRSTPQQPRSSSLLAPVHIAMVTREQILPDLFDFYGESPPGALNAGITLITGPSKTGDIELKLVTGVHGPGEVHVIVMES